MTLEQLERKRKTNREYMARQRAINPEKLYARVVQWGAKNKNKKKAADADWYARNKERKYLTRKAWTEANPEKVDLAKTKNYLARRLDMNPAAIPPDLIAAQALVMAIRRKIKHALG